MSSPYEGDGPKIPLHRTLRTLNSIVVICGLILNTTTLVVDRVVGGGNSIKDLTCAAYLPLFLSLFRNHLVDNALGRLPKGRDWVAMVTDAGLSLGFLAIVIVNAIIIDDRWDITVPRLLLWTYNSMPWIVCW